MNTPKLSNVSSKYGAPMGRADRLPDDPLAPIDLHLERLPMVDGDYDAGGAYWGGPVSSGSMHAAWNDDGVQVFVRAKDIQDAQAQVRVILPGATFDDATELDAFTRSYIMAAPLMFDELTKLSAASAKMLEDILHPGPLTGQIAVEFQDAVKSACAAIAKAKGQP